MKTIRLLLASSVLLTATFADAQGREGNPGIEANPACQAAADVLREIAGTDGAFLPAGHVREKLQADNLASMLVYPTDPIVVLKLKGSQVRAAFERSVSLYPQANSSFLQVSGFEITFNPNADPNKRITSVLAGTGKLDEDREYSIAMPSSLGYGGLGYFKIWDTSKIARTLSGTLEEALRGKRVGEFKPRWVPAP